MTTAASRITSGTAAGTPEDVAKVKERCTGRNLKEMLGRRANSVRSKRQAAE